MSEIKEVFIGEVKRFDSPEWAAQDWGYDRQSVAKKVHKRLKILNKFNELPVYTGRTARFLRMEVGEKVV